MYDLYLAAAGFGLREISAWCQTHITTALRLLGSHQQPAPADGRDLRLDLFRGLALWFIFLNHIPGNVVSWITVRNFGFSDATEIFVFISGYTAALVYGKAMRQDGVISAGARILKRAWQIYIAHVFLFVTYAAAIVFVAASTDNPQFIARMGIEEFLQQPGFMFIQVLLLRFKPANMDVLPMYIAVLAAFVPTLWLLLRRPHVALLASAVLYAMAHSQGWMLTSHTGRAWCFNPFAWQLLFVFGAWCALGGAAHLAGLVRSRAVTAAAVTYLVFALFVVTSWRVPALAAVLPEWLCGWMYPISKPNLDVLRLAEGIALAVLTVRVVGGDHRILSSAYLRPLIRCGMHSLEIFCLGVLLSFLGHAALVAFDGGVPMQVLVSATGIAVMIAAASLIAWAGSIEGDAGIADDARPARAMALQPAAGLVR